MDRAVGKLRAVVRIPTVSDRDWSRVDTSTFDDLHAALEQHFPLLHQHLEKAVVHGHGLLFRWRGESQDRPVVLMAHQDVVPVDEAAPWQHPPFSAELGSGDRGNEIWGRGTLDDKITPVCLLEAVETLLAQGFQPKRTVYLAFGHDEETTGRKGAMQIVAILPDGSRKPLMQVVGQDGSEVTGPAFDPSGTRLYFSSQRGGSGGITYEITGPFHEPV